MEEKGAEVLKYCITSYIYPTSTERYKTVVVKKNPDKLDTSRARLSGNLTPSRINMPAACPENKERE